MCLPTPAAKLRLCLSLQCSSSAERTWRVASLTVPGPVGLHLLQAQALDRGCGLQQISAATGGRHINI